MELNWHGFKRVRGRTRMLTEDVVAIILAEAVVELGRDSRGEFLLFYSPRDKSTKIAVVSIGRGVLLSIWESSFQLPQGVSKVTAKLEKEARGKLRNFLIERAKKKLIPGEVKESKPALYDLEISVCVGDIVVYRRDCGQVEKNKIKTLEEILAFLRPVTGQILSVVEDNLFSIGGPVTYDIRFKTHGAEFFRPMYHLKHETLLRMA